MKISRGNLHEENREKGLSNLMSHWHWSLSYSEEKYQKKCIVSEKSVYFCHLSIGYEPNASHLLKLNQYIRKYSYRLLYSKYQRNGYSVYLLLFCEEEGCNVWRKIEKTRNVQKQKKQRSSCLLKKEEEDWRRLSFSYFTAGWKISRRAVRNSLICRRRKEMRKKRKENEAWLKMRNIEEEEKNPENEIEEEEAIEKLYSSLSFSSKLSNIKISGSELWAYHISKKIYWRRRRRSWN